MQQTLNQTKTGMEAAIEHFKKELKGLRSGRANPAILDGVVVEVYGTEMRIRDLANISVPEPRQIVVTPFDAQTAGPIAKGIEKANLNIQPIVEGKVVRIPIPPLNEELRKDLVKQAKKKAEDAKVVVREARRKGNDQLKKLKTDSTLAEDEMKKAEKTIQEMTDKYCKQIDDLMHEKEKEKMSI